MTHAPTTLHEHFRADPRGADSFGRWIEDRIWELLQRPARGQSFIEGEWFEVAPKDKRRTAAQEICIAVSLNESDPRMPPVNRHSRRVLMLDGTIIKEWAAASEAAKDQASKAADLVDG